MNASKNKTLPTDVNEAEEASKRREVEAQDRMMNTLKNFMWWSLMEHGQEPSLKRLRGYVYDLIGMMTQKEGGQRSDKKKNVQNIETELDMTMFSIVIETVALVLSGALDPEREDNELKNSVQQG